MKMKKIDITEIEGFRIGNAENADAGTGVTVIIAEGGAVAGVDVRGGGPATRETDLLRSENTVDRVNAVVLSGGSAFGLEAASGVMRELSERGEGFRVGDISVPIVPAASLFDLSVGRSDVYPDFAMGREAVRNAFAGEFSTGNHGAGTGASCGKMLGMNRAMKTGLGTFACGDDVIQVGAVSAVNACADIYNGAGNIIAGLRTGDGSAILGTIKVLKEMIHPDSEPDMGMEDFRAGASSRFRRSEKLTEKKEDDEAASAAIARDLMTAYENSLNTPEEVQVEPSADEQITATDPAAASVSAESVREDNTAPEDAETALGNSYEDIIIDHEEDGADSAQPYGAEEDEQDEPEYFPNDDAQIYGGHEEQAEAQDYPDYTDGYRDIDSDGPDDANDAGEQAEADPASGLMPAADDTVYDMDMGYDVQFNTTIGCLITNAVLTKSQANKLASILHDAYARAVKPVHSTMDGDTIFVMSTCTQPVNFDAFAALATDVMQYAVIDGAQSAEGAYGLPAARDIIR